MNDYGVHMIPQGGATAARHSKTTPKGYLESSWTVAQLLARMWTRLSENGEKHEQVFRMLQGLMIKMDLTCHDIILGWFIYLKFILMT